MSKKKLRKIAQKQTTSQKSMNIITLGKPEPILTTHTEYQTFGMTMIMTITACP